MSSTLAAECILSLSTEAIKQGIRSPQMELLLTPPIGYKGHGTSPDIFYSGSLWIKEKLGLA